MDTLDNQSFSDKGTGLSALAMETLRNTIPWMRFMAIMGFIGVGFIVIAAFILGATGYEAGMIAMVAYLIGAVIAFFPAMFIYQYAGNLAYYLESRQMHDLEIALGKQKNYYVYVGVIIIIYLALIVIGLVFNLGRSGF
jgi:hypothetical protein